MRSLPIAVLFSLVSLVAAFGKRGHNLRDTQVTHLPWCPTTTGRIHSKTSGIQSKATGMPSQTNLKKQNQTVTSGSRYQLTRQYMGQDFLDETKWAAFTRHDLTHGLVQYVSHDTAVSEGMSYVLPNGAAVLSVDNKTDLPLNTPRKSIRIVTTQSFNGGLFIADFARMPFGCSLWPAYWSVGTAEWPTDGEIDILEGVNNQLTNQMTLHTGPQCFIDENPSSPFTGNVLHKACESSASDNKGCSFGDPDPSSFGPGLKEAGGGVFAHLWNQDGIKVWHFKRSSIPQDITSGSPDPSSWPTPVAFWDNADCDMASHFIDHSLVIDTTLCGDWAGNSNVYANSGCPGTCAEAVTKASNFENAYWEINSIKVYNTVSLG